MLYLLQMATIDGSINATEREIREFANISAIRDGGIDLDVTRKKRRLNAELDSLLDKMQSKREEFLKLDAECVTYLFCNVQCLFVTTALI